MNSILDNLSNYYMLLKSTIKNNILLIILLIIIFSTISYYLYITTLQTYFDKNSNKEYTPKKTQNNKNEATIYYFYTTWCPHCTEATGEIQQLENEVKIINKSQKNIIIFLRRIDCDKSDNEKLLKKHKVNGFPTIILEHKNKIYNYEAKPNAKHLTEFVKDSLNIKDI